MKMGEISINHKLRCQPGKSCSVVMALIMQLILTDIFSFYSVCKDISYKYLPGYFSAKLVGANLIFPKCHVLGASGSHANHK